MNLGDIVKNYREEKGISQRQFANLAGLSNGYISMLESNCNPKTGEPLQPSITAMKKVAEVMHYTLNELMMIIDDIPVSLDDDTDLPSGLLPVYIRKLPIIGGIAAGEPIYSPEEAEVFMVSEVDQKCDFALLVKGDSMMPTYQDGDIVFVRKQSTQDYEGQIVALWIDDGAVLKHIYHAKNGVQLVSDNLKYAPMVFSNDDAESAYIIGVPVGYYRKV